MKEYYILLLVTGIRVLRTNSIQKRKEGNNSQFNLKEEVRIASIASEFNPA